MENLRRHRSYPGVQGRFPGGGGISWKQFRGESQVERNMGRPEEKVLGVDKQEFLSLDEGKQGSRAGSAADASVT